MSSEIYYDKAFIRVGGKYIPVVNHGSSNCFDFDRRGQEIPEKYWSVLRYPYRDKVLFTADEIQIIADACEDASMGNRGGTRKSRNRAFEEGEFRRWILAGMKSAHTVEEYEKFGNSVAVIDYNADPWQRYFAPTTGALLDKLRELDSHSVTVSFWDDRHVNHPPMRQRGQWKPVDFSTLPEYYVLKTEHGYFIKYSSKRIWFADSRRPGDLSIRKFQTEKAARKYLDNHGKIFARFPAAVERIQTGEAVS